MKSLSVLWRKKTLSEKLLRPMTLITLLAVGLSVVTWAAATATSQEPKSDDSTRHKTLRQLALERDLEFDVSDSCGDWEYGDLRWLGKYSDAIVLGRLREEESFFDGENHISTRYVVDLSRIFKDGTSESLPLWRAMSSSFLPKGAS